MPSSIFLSSVCYNVLCGSHEPDSVCVCVCMRERDIQDCLPFFGSNKLNRPQFGLKLGSKNRNRPKKNYVRILNSNQKFMTILDIFLCVSMTMLDHF